MGTKGQIWISAILYILITTIILTIILDTGIPLLNDMKDRAIFTNTKNDFVALNQEIKDISESGPGTQKVIPIEIKKGDLAIDDNKIQWNMETTTDIIAPNSKISLGDVKILSNADVRSYETPEHFIIENPYLEIRFNKIGTLDNFTMNETKSIIHKITYKNTKSSLTGKFTFELKDYANSESGYLFTELSSYGKNQISSSLLAHIISDAGKNYTVEISLQSNADFFNVKTYSLK